MSVDRSRVITIGAFLLAAGASAPLYSQGAKSPPPPAHDSVVVSVLTMGPGEELFERFGHQSIRYHDVTTGLDTAYNWGMFSFEQPHFIVRFLTGDTRYWMMGFPSLPLIDEYKKQRREVWEQELNLTTAEKDSLWRFLQWNAKEENKWYRYDYYRDNCATRVRDALNMILGGSVQRAVGTNEHGVSYRTETMRLSRAYPMINFGMDFVLGRPADDTLSAWEEMFVPMRLQQQIRSIRVKHSDGHIGRLVLRERQLVVDDRYKDHTAPPGYFTMAATVSLCICAVVLGLCLLPAASPVGRWTLAGIGSVWHLIVGTVGVILMAADLFTRHAAYMGHNDNVLLATPVSLGLAFMIPLAMRRGASQRLVRATIALSPFVVVCAVIAVLLRFIPALHQANREMLVLALPVHAALAFAAWRALSSNLKHSGEIV